MLTDRDLATVVVLVGHYMTVSRLIGAPCETSRSESFITVMVVLRGRLDGSATIAYGPGMDGPGHRCSAFGSGWCGHGVTVGVLRDRDVVATLLPTPSTASSAGVFGPSATSWTNRRRRCAGGPDHTGGRRGRGRHAVRWGPGPRTLHAMSPTRSGPITFRTPSMPASVRLAVGREGLGVSRHAVIAARTRGYG